MQYHLLWNVWGAFLAAAAVTLGLVSLVALIILVGNDPTRADAWVWGLAAASVVGDLVGVVSGPRRPRGLRLAAASWGLRVASAVALILLVPDAQGLVVLGYVLAASAVVSLPDAIGLWPGPIGVYLPPRPRGSSRPKGAGSTGPTV